MGPARFHCATLLPMNYMRETQVFMRINDVICHAFFMLFVLILTKLSFKSSSDMDHFAIALDASFPVNTL